MNEATKTIIVDGIECICKGFRYIDDNLAICLYEKNTDEEYRMVTVNLGREIPFDHTYIKNYSENEGLLEILQEAGIVKKIVKYVPSGYVNLPLCIIDMNLIA